MKISFSSTGDDSDSVRGGKATLTTPPAKEKRKNFFKKPVNDFDESQCLWLLQSFLCVHSSDVVLDYFFGSLVVDRELVHDRTNSTCTRSFTGIATPMKIWAVLWKKFVENF